MRNKVLAALMCAVLGAVSIFGFGGAQAAAGESVFGDEVKSAAAEEPVAAEGVSEESVFEWDPDKGYTITVNEVIPGAKLVRVNVDFNKDISSASPEDYAYVYIILASNINDLTGDRTAAYLDNGNPKATNAALDARYATEHIRMSGTTVGYVFPADAIGLVPKTQYYYRLACNIYDDDSSGYYFNYLTPVGSFTTLEDSIVPDSNFKDSEFLAVVKDKAGVDVDVANNLHVSDLENIYQFIDIEGSSSPGATYIEDITGIDTLVNAYQVSIKGHEISDMSPVKGLRFLQNLDLESNDIRTIPDLTDLTYLSSINLEQNIIPDEEFSPDKFPAGIEYNTVTGWQRSWPVVEAVYAAGGVYYNINGKQPFLVSFDGLRNAYRSYTATLTIGETEYDLTPTYGSSALYMYADTNIAPSATEYNAVVEIKDNAGTGRTLYKGTRKVVFTDDKDVTGDAYVHAGDDSLVFTDDNSIVVTGNWSSERVITATLDRGSAKLPVTGDIETTLTPSTYENRYRDLPSTDATYSAVNDLVGTKTRTVMGTVTFSGLKNLNLTAGDYDLMVSDEVNTTPVKFATVHVTDKPVVTGLEIAKASPSTGGITAAFDNTGDYLYVESIGPVDDPTTNYPVLYLGDTAVTTFDATDPTSVFNSHYGTVYRLKKTGEGIWNSPRVFSFGFAGNAIIHIEKEYQKHIEYDPAKQGKGEYLDTLTINGAGSADFYIGDKRNLEAVFTPQDFGGFPLAAWYTSNSAVVELEKKGNPPSEPFKTTITAVAAGEATIIVNYGGKIASMKYKVSEKPAVTTYKITYDLAGGTVTGGTNPETYDGSAAITLINPTKEGYTFDGWTGTDLTEATKTVTIAAGSTGDRAYTATWTASADNTHKHDLKKHYRLEPTETTEGNIEYWECQDETCKKLFADADATQEITLAQTVIAKLPDARKTEEKPAPVTETKTINEKPVEIKTEVSYAKAVTWTGSKITKEQLAALSGDGVIAKIEASGIEDAMTKYNFSVNPSDLFTVNYNIDGKKVTNDKDKAYFTVKVKLNSKAVKRAKLKKKDKKALKEMVDELNKQLENEKHYFEIRPVQLDDENVSINIKSTFKKKLVQTNEDGSIKNLKTITIKVKVPAGKNGKTKTKTYTYKSASALKKFSVMITDATQKNTATADVTATAENESFVGTRTGVTVKK